MPRHAGSLTLKLIYGITPEERAKAEVTIHRWKLPLESDLHTRVTAGDPRERSQGCCSIRAVGMRLRGGCLHGTALGSHQLVRSPKSTILSGEAESCPDAGRFEVGVKQATWCTTAGISV